MEKNKTILISGCAGKVGGAVAELFSQRGWDVVGLDLSPKAENTDSYYQCDLKDFESVKQIIETIEESEAIEAVFHGVGMSLECGFEDMNMEDWEELLRTVLGGAANLCRAAAPYMIQRKQGKIILLAPDYRWVKGDCIMEASAAGTLHGFAKSFGAEVAKDNILVNALAPNVPIDRSALAETVFYLAEQDSYTAAQVISMGGVKDEI